MRDLSSPLLPRNVVSELVGVSPQTLRRWDSLGIPSRVGRRRNSGLYSWREVDEVQWAAYFVKARRVSLTEAKRLLERGTSSGPIPLLIKARAKSPVRRRKKGGVRIVTLPRSARRREAESRR